MTKWEDIQVTERVDEKHKVSLELIRVPWMLPTFTLSMGRRFIKLKYEKKISNIKKI